MANESLPSTTPKPTLVAQGAVAEPTPQISPLPVVTVPSSPTAIVRPTGPASPPARPSSTPIPPPPTVPFETPEGYIDPENFPAGLNPFTGLPLPPARAARRPLAVKISNYPPLVRPQWGLNSADLVFEHLTEGNVTRFTALFYGREAERVGSIRSGRLIDLEIPVMYDAGFAYSGASGPIRERLRSSVFFERIVSPDFGHGGFDRLPDGDLAFEHTLFTNTITLRYHLDLRGEDRPPILQNHMAFSAAPPAGGTAVRRIEIRYGGVNAFWGWMGDGTYARWTDGEPHLDAADGDQLSASNVVVLAAHHQATDFLEDEAGGGHLSIEIQIWGEGPASLFRDGRRYEGRWERRHPEEMLTLIDLNGRPLPLAPGRSFFQIVPLGFDALIVEP